MLTVLRNKAKENQNIRLADEINNTLLVNHYEDGIDYYKLMPTQIDRTPYQNLINGIQNREESQISGAYTYFSNKLERTGIEPERIKNVIRSYFSIVSIVLDARDNPYLVFESLNATGRPLTQADLIRNYFFMRIHVNEQEEVYQNCWLPMQEALGEYLTEFIRHYLMKDGGIIKQSDIYYALKDRMSSIDAIEYLNELKQYSEYYQRLILNLNKSPNYRKCLGGLTE